MPGLALGWSRVNSEATCSAFDQVLHTIFRRTWLLPLYLFCTFTCRPMYAVIAEAAFTGNERALLKGNAASTSVEVDTDNVVSPNTSSSNPSNPPPVPVSTISSPYKRRPSTHAELFKSKTAEALSLLKQQTEMVRKDVLPTIQRGMVRDGLLAGLMMVQATILPPLFFGGATNDPGLRAFLRGMFGFSITSLLYSLWCFDTRWTRMGWSYEAKLRHLESAWPYFLGFVFPLMAPSVLMGFFEACAVSGCIYPLMMAVATVTDTEAASVAALKRCGRQLRLPRCTVRIHGESGRLLLETRAGTEAGAEAAAGGGGGAPKNKGSRSSTIATQNPVLAIPRGLFFTLPSSLEPHLTKVAMTLVKVLTIGEDGEDDQGEDDDDDDDEEEDDQQLEQRTAVGLLSRESSWEDAREDIAGHGVEVEILLNDGEGKKNKKKGDVRANDENIRKRATGNATTTLRAAQDDEQGDNTKSREEKKDN